MPVTLASVSGDRGIMRTGWLANLVEKVGFGFKERPVLKAQGRE